MSSSKIVTKRVDPVFYILINRPHKKNAIDAETYELLIAALNQANSVDDIFITVLTGEGDFYSAGNDFNVNDLHNINKSANETVELVHQFVNALIDHTKILVAQVNGPAIGIACTTLPLFDSVIASNHAYFYCPFTKLGILPEGTSTHTWPELMGHSQAARLLLFSEKVCAQEAKQLGLVNKVFVHQKFQEQSNEVIQEYASLTAKACLQAKRLMRSKERVAFLRAINRTEINAIHESLKEINMANVRERALDKTKSNI
ncbi:enoyl-CoA hydratase/isomerase domain-containing protein [Ditylenchus destructor]|uniref:Enoyl-CoA hydratase/isomerase domain-containing protein n=1 Tax=Ditylenchus destructor TaxID=166010 RepID=A0AAD4NH71_9BILA|nr:enoyl-CoA hydratase/isomerase domain-containing protein [Ditylenchus destructor]